MKLTRWAVAAAMGIVISGAVFAGCARAPRLPADVYENFERPISPAATAGPANPSAPAPDALPEGWRAISGEWKIEKGALIGNSPRGLGLITFGDETWRNYEIEMDATFLEARNPSRWLAIVFRAAADGEAPWSQYPIRLKTTFRNGAEFSVRRGNRWSVRRTAKGERDTHIGETRHLRVAVRENRIECFLDGELMLDSPLCLERDAGCVGLAISGVRARFDNFHIRFLPDEPREADNPSERHVGVVAHRGFSDSAPENTLVAIREAIDAGADGSEFDVWKCRSGELILMHDNRVDRTTDGKGEIKRLTLTEIKRLDAGSWKNARYAGEPVPTLDEALALLKDSGTRAVVEIKGKGLASEVLDAVERAGMHDQTTIISFDSATVGDIRRLDPDIQCAWLFGKNIKGTMAERAQWIADEAAKCGAKIVNVEFKLLSRELIADLNRRGLRVWTWTVDEPLVMAELIRSGVDKVTTNRPDVALELMHR